MSAKAVKELRPSYLADAANDLIATSSKSIFDLVAFFEKFNLLARVESAIPRLREIILELAIRGKLVPQLNDAPCVSSDREIAKRKQPHSIPDTWRWVTFADAADIEMGNSPPGDSYNDVGTGTPLVNGPVEFTPGPFGLTRKIKFTTSPTRMCKQGDLLICVRGSTTGRTNIAAFDACIGRGVAAISPKVEDRYVHIVVLSMRNHIFESGKGSTFKSITQAQLRSYPIPLPPLAEQKRIVAKVDELMGLCDRLEALEAERKQRHAPLSRAVLARFADSPTPTNLQFIFHNSFDVEPQELRETILSMAVLGKLVSVGSMPDDIPSFDENDPVLSEQLSVPAHWGACEIGTIIDSIGSGWSPKCDETPADSGEWGVLKTTAVQTLRYDEFANKRLPPSLTARPDCEVQDGDILFTRAGPFNRVGIVCVARPTRAKLMLSDKIIRIQLKSFIYPEFAALALNTGKSSEVIQRLKSGMAASQVNISQTKLRTIPLPVPPLAEQKRIVAKVDELMELVDQLEQQLAHSRTLGQQLLEAVVANITAC